MSAKSLALICAATVLTALSSAAHANACYVLKNASKGIVPLNFAYSGPVAEGSPVHIDMQPGGVYPPQGQWCWNTPGYTATMTYGGQVKQSWNGTLVLGNGPTAYPGGTYTISDNVAPAPAPAGKCLGSPYPGAKNYCLKNVGKDVQMHCGMGNAHRNGNFSARSGIQLVCHNGKAWQLTCLKDGTGCNVNDTEFCTGLSQWDVGQHCTEHSNNNDFPKGNWKP